MEKVSKFNFEHVEEMKQKCTASGTVVESKHYDRLRFGERKLIVKQKFGGFST